MKQEARGVRLTNISIIQASLRLLTGLHIGAGGEEMHIGGVDNPVIRHPLTQEPYIPGSSLKGKIRSLLEWRSGAVQQKPLSWKEKDKQGVLPILKLFGIGGGDQLSDAEAVLLGPTRLSFWDCPLQEGWAQRMRRDYLPLTEVKSENIINRVTSVAESPRQTERVPADAVFDFRLSFKRLDGDGGDLLEHVLAGLKLLELDSLGGSGSRGYGKVRFEKLTIDDQDESRRFEETRAFS
jgi:CRISPR-associated protein Csm3